MESTTMASIRTVVVATDFSRTSVAAVERGAHLAVQLGARLCLLHALDEKGAPAPGSTRGGAPQAPAVAPAEQEARQALAENAAALARRLSVEVTTHCEAGSPAAVIQAWVKASPGALVVVGSRADLDLEGLGSTASDVVRMPAAPTLVVRALESHPYGTVLCAVDLRAGSVRAASLAVEVFPQAHHHLLYALDPVLPGDEPEDAAADRQRLADYDAKKAKVDLACRRLALQLSASTAHPVHAIVAEDVPERAILVAAAELGADCVVVGHHGEGPATNSALGSMAEHVVHSAISDVLVVV
jgi:nucleotide-binding universal stress UspA family protein